MNHVIKYGIAAVWLVNGLWCKVLNGVPRHAAIVARILGPQHAGILTKLIGCLEIAMAVWIVSSIKRRLNAVMQMVVIGSMNILEALLAPDLLLWGPWNALFALLFIGFIYYNEFYTKNQLVSPT
jgi:hypothetical protein